MTKAQRIEEIMAMGMKEVKEMAKTKEWAKFCSYLPQTHGKKANFIGVSKKELAEYIADMEQHESDISMMDEIDREQEMMGNDMGGSNKGETDKSPATPEEVPVVTLKEIAYDLKMTEKALRRQLRLKDFPKPGTRWEWPSGHPDIEKVRALKPRPKTQTNAAHESAKA